MIKNSYKCLSKNIFEELNYKLVPLRFEDRFKIMKWRNEQIYHLRQTTVLTKEKQNEYFESTIAKLFEQDKPDQLLFSLLNEGDCIGYGGLVHIDWELKTAEISFLMDTSLEFEQFEILWTKFLKLIERVAYDHLFFRRIFTFSYDLRPRLYKVLDKSKYKLERTIKNSIKIKNQFVDAKIHSKYSNEFLPVDVSIDHKELLFEWSNDVMTRENSISSEKIQLEEHNEWMKKMLENEEIKCHIFLQKGREVGMLRIDPFSLGNRISFSVDKRERGKGIGSKIIMFAINQYSNSPLFADVLLTNSSSQAIFKKFGFKEINRFYKNNKLIIKYLKNEINFS